MCQRFHDTVCGCAVFLEVCIGQLAVEVGQTVGGLGFFFYICAARGIRSACCGVNRVEQRPADHNRNVGFACLNLGDRCIECRCACCTGCLNTHARYAEERRVHFGQQRADMALIVVQLGKEAADKAGYAVFFIEGNNIIIGEVGVRAAVRHNLAQHCDHVFTFAAPVTLEVGLSAAHYIYFIHSIAPPFLTACP